MNSVEFMTSPWSQNLYTYCGNNPVCYVDPTGHFGLPNPAPNAELTKAAATYLTNLAEKVGKAALDYIDSFGSTQVVGVSGFVNQIYSTGESKEICWDDSGNIALFETQHNGEGTQQVSGLISYTTTNADSVYSLRGSSGEFGASANILSGFGLDVIFADEYQGLQFSGGISVVPEEVHIRYNLSDYMLLYDTNNNILKINVDFILADIYGGELKYLIQRHVTNTVDDRNVVEIDFNFE